MSGWTDARVETLMRLWRDGFSASEIARELKGVSRNAVLGKLDRLGLLGSRPPASAPSRAPSRAPRRAAPPPALVVPVFAPRPRPAPSGPPGPRIIAKLGHRECRWPVGKDPGLGNGDLQLFCAEPTDVGQTYCAAHLLRLYQNTRTPEQKAADEARAAKMRAAKGHKRDANSLIFGAGRDRAA